MFDYIVTESVSDNNSTCITTSSVIDSFVTNTFEFDISTRKHHFRAKQEITANAKHDPFSFYKRNEPRRIRTKQFIRQISQRTAIFVENTIIIETRPTRYDFTVRFLVCDVLRKYTRKYNSHCLQLIFV